MKVIQKRAGRMGFELLTNPKYRLLPAYLCPSKASSFLCTLKPQGGRSQAVSGSAACTQPSGRKTFFPRASLFTEILAESVGSAVCRRPVRCGSAGKLGCS